MNPAPLIPPLAASRSAEAKQGQNCENDNHGSDEPDDAVHGCLLSIQRFVGDGPGTSGIRPHAKPTRFRIAMTMTIAPTNQTMLFMTSLLVC
jgi:hypothetical protein